MQTITPSKNIIPALRVWACIVLALCAFIYGIIMVFSVVIALLLCLFTAILFLAVWLYYIPAYSKSILVNISNTSVSISRGVILKKKYIIPNSRQVYAQRFKTPVSTFFDITNVTINLARGKVTVFGLTKIGADTLIQHVSEVSKNR